MSVQAELDRIRKRNNGLLRPEDVVKAAEPKNSVLHSKFDWDDTTAAHSWRLEQARHIIRVFVEIVDNGNKNIESRVFVALSSDRENGGGYRTMSDVMSSASMRKALLQDALEDMRRFAQKYAALKELADVFEAIRKVKAGKVGRVAVRQG